MWLPTSFPRRDNRRDDGFSLLEVVCVLAILAIIAAIAIPRMPHSTSRAQLEAYATTVASLLKADRYAAVRRRSDVATEVNAAARIVRSGATGFIVQIPPDVAVDTQLAARCQHHQREPNIRFFSSGMSCGGIIVLSRAGLGYEVRVNWLTGGIEIAAITRG